MITTFFFPEPGWKRLKAFDYAWRRGFLKTARSFEGRLVFAPRSKERVRTKQKNYLIRELSIEPKRG